MARKSKQTKAKAPKPGRLTPSPGALPELTGRAAAFFAPYARGLEILAVVCLIAAGISFRLGAVDTWRQAEPLNFYEGQPLHTTFDAYFYLSLAQDIIDNTYNEIDEKRGIPESPARPAPPPLLSVLAAQIAEVSGWGLGWIGAVMPAVLGGLLALPLYLLGRYYSGAAAGFSAALLALLYPFYLYRSGFGRFDTDCLNVTFVLLSAYLCIRFAETTTWKRYAYAGLALLNYGIFLWWWDQAPAAVTALVVFPFAVALIFYYRPAKREAGVFFGAVCLCLVAISAVKGPDFFIGMPGAVFQKYLYISKESAGAFPDVGRTIREQLVPPVSVVVELTTGSLSGFLFALAGICLLLYKRFKPALFLGPLMILSVFAFTKAARFIIFLVPVLAIGSGFLLGELWKQRARFSSLRAVCPLLFLFLAAPLYLQKEKNVAAPTLPAASVACMDAALHMTPPDAVVWAWWDNGYALTYYARRATVNDGSLHSGERTTYTALPLALTDFRLAANFMHFYVMRGFWGINHFCWAARLDRQPGMDLILKILAAGPDGARPLIEQANLWSWCFKTTGDWLGFFFPPESRPVYLYLDALTARVAHLWYWFGTWNSDTRTGKKPLYRMYEGLGISGAKIADNRGTVIDINSGELLTGGRSVQLAQLSIRTARELRKKKYTTASTYQFDMNEISRYGALTDKKSAATLFNRLFVRLEADNGYFSMVKQYGSACQLWEVRGDVYTGNGGERAAAGVQPGMAEKK